ncbi:MAG TPA: DUF2231 domain-containing protein [Dehalococcoidia bacterium]
MNDVLSVTVLGLPIHALVVHFAVVMVPAAGFALIAAGVKPEWRNRYLWMAAGLAVVAAGAAIVTAASGEQLQDTVRQSARLAGSRATFGDHPEQGDMARNLAVLMALAGCGFVAVQRWGKKLALPAWTPTAAYAVTTVVSLAAIASIVIAGHSGATLVWKDLGNFVSASKAP